MRSADRGNGKRESFWHGSAPLVIYFREAKRALYSRRGAEEYWIIDWMNKLIEIYTRSNSELEIVATLGVGEVLTTVLLPEFSNPVDLFFRGIP